MFNEMTKLRITAKLSKFRSKITSEWVSYELFMDSKRIEIAIRKIVKALENA